MPSYTYLIVGGGMTAAAAIAGIREVDPRGAIGVMGAEGQLPYDRPPLSKGLWKDKPLESIWRKVEGPGVTFHLRRHARQLDPQAKSASPMIKARSTRLINCCWPQDARCAAFPLAAIGSFISARWTITTGCAA